MGVARTEKQIGRRGGQIVWRMGQTGADIPQHPVRGRVAEFAARVELLFIEELINRRLIGKLGVLAPVTVQIGVEFLDGRCLQQDQRSGVPLGWMFRLVPILWIKATRAQAHRRINHHRRDRDD